MTALLSVRDLTVQFSLHGNGLGWGRRLTLTAVDRVGFDLCAGETLGVVGESGRGNSPRPISNPPPLLLDRVEGLGQAPNRYGSWHRGPSLRCA